MDSLDDTSDTGFKQFEIKEGVAFLIELSDDMFEPLEELENRSQLLEILSSINELLAELIITLPSTGIGIYFYNSGKTYKGYPRDSGLTRLFKLNDINSFNMKLLNDVLVDHVEGKQTLRHRFPVALEASHDKDRLPTVLNVLLDEFHSKPHYNNKKLIWFTTNDRPYKSERTKHVLWKIINDFEENLISISPIFLDRFDGKDKTKKKFFDTSLYEQIFLNTNYLKASDAGTSNEVHKGFVPNNQSYQMRKNWDAKVKSEDADIFGPDFKRLVFDGISPQSDQITKPTLSTNIRQIILRVKQIRRIQFACNLILSDGNGIGGNLGCSIRGYAMYSQERLKKYKKIYNEGDNLKIVNTSTSHFDERTESTIDSLYHQADEDSSFRLRRGIPLGSGKVFYLSDKQISFLKNYAFDHSPNTSKSNYQDEKRIKDDPDMVYDEMSKNDSENDSDDDSLEFSEAPYLKLLGFRSLSTFHYSYVSGPPIFVTPDLNNGFLSMTSEGGFKNSFKTFSSLYQSCKKLQKYALLFGCTKRNSPPSLYALYPTRVKKSTKLINNFPEGFFLIRTPWLDDIRSFPEDLMTDSIYRVLCEDDSTYTHLKQEFKSLLSQFFVRNYTPQDFPNPSLNYFYKVIKAELLQEELKEEDTLLVANDIAYKRLRELYTFLMADPDRLNAVRNINHLVNQMEKQFRRPVTSLASVKRQKPSATHISDQEITEAWKNNLWSKITVAQLRTYALERNEIKMTLKKQDLIDNIISYLKSKH